MNNVAEQVSSLTPGAVIRVNRGIYDHVGLVADYTIRGEPAVLSFSPQGRGLTEQTLSEFCADGQVKLDRYPGRLPPGEVMRRARLWQGLAYSWAERNCEHFVRYAHGLPIESPQLQFAFWGGLTVLALMLARA